LEDGQLMAQREVLEHQGVLGPDPAEEAGEDEGEHGGHHPSGPVPSVYPSRLLLRGKMGGWRSGGRPSPGEDTDREQNVAKDREPDTRLAGGEGDAGREGNPVAIDVSIAGAATGRRLCGPAGVPMMEAADHGRRDDAAPVGTLHRSERDTVRA
jgi:hypothetical protein